MFYIHIEDPGFPGEPWPGQRRFGPYNTSDEGLAQAASDWAQGHGKALGVWDEDSDGYEDGTAEPLIGPDAIEVAAKALAENLATSRANARQDQTDALAAFLDARGITGATADEILALATTPQDAT